MTAVCNKLSSSVFLFALRHLCMSNHLPGWLSGHLAKPPTRRSCVERMKLLFLSKFVYWNTSNSWDSREGGGGGGGEQGRASVTMWTNLKLQLSWYEWGQLCVYHTAHLLYTNICGVCTLAPLAQFWPRNSQFSCFVSAYAWLCLYPWLTHSW